MAPWILSIRILDTRISYPKVFGSGSDSQKRYPNFQISRFEQPYQTVGFGSDKERKVLWRCATLAILWVIWLEWNDRVFNKRRVDRDLLWDRVVFLASLWAKASGAFSLGYRETIGGLLYYLDSLSYLVMLTVSFLSFVPRGLLVLFYVLLLSGAMKLFFL